MFIILTVVVIEFVALRFLYSPFGTIDFPRLRAGRLWARRRAFSCRMAYDFYISELGGGTSRGDGDKKTAVQ